MPLLTSALYRLILSPSTCPQTCSLLLSDDGLTIDIDTPILDALAAQHPEVFPKVTSAELTDQLSRISDPLKIASLYELCSEEKTYIHGRRSCNDGSFHSVYPLVSLFILIILRAPMMLTTLLIIMNLLLTDILVSLKELT